jgi:hypothetical protein
MNIWYNTTKNKQKAVKEESRRGFCPREKIPEAESIFTI